MPSARGTGSRTACSKHVVKSRSRDCEMAVSGHEHPDVGTEVGEEADDDAEAIVRNGTSMSVLVDEQSTPRPLSLA